LKRTCLVTGASRGLGLEACRLVAEQGLRVVLTSRTAAGRDAARRLEARGLDVSHLLLDVTDAASIRALADAYRGEGVSIDVLVNNAGIALDGFNARVARDTIETNFFGPLRVTEALLPVIGDGGHVVMVSSGMGELRGVSPELGERFADPALTRDGLVELVQSFVKAVEDGRHAKLGWPSSAYRVSKVALNALTRSFARSFEPRRIRVNAVCPGWVRTDMGGAGASRSVEQGAASIVGTALLESGPTGGFFRDQRAIAW